MSNNIMIVILVAVVLYVTFAGAGNAATTTVAQGGGNCLQAIQQQYSGQWAEMNQVQRAMVGLRASACEEGR